MDDVTRSLSTAQTHQGSPGLEQIRRDRARMYSEAREYFHAHGVLEVETPVINPTTVSDPHIDSIAVTCSGQQQFLHTSAEYAMRALLAHLKCDIYQLCKVFRDGESGRLHHSEFTMLEWYRVGWNYLDLMTEVDDLVRVLLHDTFHLEATEFIPCQELFRQYCGIDPWSCTKEDYLDACRKAGLTFTSRLPVDAYQSLLLDQTIATHLPGDRMIFVHDFPPEQACLARINDQGKAERFELYVAGLELANGYQELVDAGEQRRRIDSDNKKRQALGKRSQAPDGSLIAALERGLPECAGVALGMDRLLMLATGVDDISKLLECPAG